MNESDATKKKRGAQPGLPPLEDNPVFRELVADLKRQTPEQRERCQELVNDMANERERNES